MQAAACMARYNTPQAFAAVASRKELVTRIKSRVAIEAGDTRLYQSERWAALLDRIDLFRVYEAFFEFLDERGIPFEVVHSSARRADTPFIPADRACVFRLLQGGKCVIPSLEATRAVAKAPCCEYQTVLLPHGIRTASNYKHLDNRESFLSILPHDLEGKTVLDIGSALGGLLAAAERLGAGPGVGVELTHKRHAGAVRIKELLSSGNRRLPSPGAPAIGHRRPRDLHLRQGGLIRDTPRRRLPPSYRRTRAHQALERRRYRQGALYLVQQVLHFPKRSGLPGFCQLTHCTFAP